MLSLKRYRWLCVLGAEVAYFICLLGERDYHVASCLITDDVFSDGTDGP